MGILKIFVNGQFLKSFRVNYVFSLYPIHYILIWFIIFQLCQFGPQPFNVILILFTQSFNITFMKNIKAL